MQTLQVQQRRRVARTDTSASAQADGPLLEEYLGLPLTGRKQIRMGKRNRHSHDTDSDSSKGGSSDDGGRCGGLSS